MEGIKIRLVCWEDGKRVEKVRPAARADSMMCKHIASIN
jgi:hypothetical protein